MALKDALKKIQKRFPENKGLIYDPTKKIEFIKTGCLPLDTFVGGFPKGRLTELFGLEASGKTSLMLSAAAKIIKEGGTCIFMDFEHAFNADFNKRAFGLDAANPNFLLFSPFNSEEGLGILDEIVNDPDDIKIDAIFIDSLSTCKSKDEVEGSLEDAAKIGSHARTIGRVIPKLNLYAAKKDCAVVMISQLRAAMNLNPYAAKNGMGNMDSSDHATTGGNAPKYYCSLRLFLKNTTVKQDTIDPVTGVMSKNIQTGNVTKFKVIKNKVGIPFITFQSTFDNGLNGYQAGWNVVKDIAFYLESMKLVKQSGSKFTYIGSTEENNFTMNGPKEQCLNALLSSPHLLEDAKNQIINNFKNSKGIKLEDESGLEVSNEEYDDERSPEELAEMEA